LVLCFNVDPLTDEDEDSTIFGFKQKLRDSDEQTQVMQLRIKKQGQRLKKNEEEIRLDFQEEIEQGQRSEKNEFRDGLHI